MRKSLAAVSVFALIALSGCGAAVEAASDSKADSTSSASAKAGSDTKKPAKKMTKGQEQAVGAAEDYLRFQAFSRKGLIHQLSSKAGSGFSKKDATYAVDHIKVDWNEQAAKAAKSYLDTMHFSRSGLVHQLESDAGSQFTHAQAVYGVKKVGL